METEGESDFSRLKSDPKAEGRRRPLGETLLSASAGTALRNLLGSSDLSRPRKELYRELVEGSASDPLSERHGWTTEEIRSHWNWAPGSSFLNNSEFSAHLATCAKCVTPCRLELQSGAWQTCPIALAAAVAWKKRLSTPSTTASEFARFWDHVGEWTARIEPKQLVLLDVGYVRGQRSSSVSG